MDALLLECVKGGSNMLVIFGDYYKWIDRITKVREKTVLSPMCNGSTDCQARVRKREVDCSDKQKRETKERQEKS